MNRLRLALLALIATVTIIAQAAVPKLPDEHLRYRVMFKWGLINKKAGQADMTLRFDAATDTYTATVYARSEPWADRVYSLRDTLTTVMGRHDLAPLRYERRAHEHGRYEWDQIAFTRNKEIFTAECIHRRRRKNETELSEKRTYLEAEGMTVDFISAFFYLRMLEFTKMLPDHTVTINIFSGKRKELLQFTFKGIESVKVGDVRQNAFKVEFKFTSDGKKNTSDPITAWISTDKQRVPLLIEGKLPIGKIKCELDR